MAKKQEPKAKAKESKAKAEEPVVTTLAKKGKEAAAPKEPKVSTKFRLTDKEVKFKPGGQVELIVVALKKLKEASITEITKEIEGKLTTKQSPKSVVSFYMTSMKKAGTIETVKAA